MDELIQLLIEVNETIDYTQEQGLLTNGVWDSLDVVDMMQRVEEHYGVKIPVECLKPVYIDSAQSIYDMIQRLRGGI